MHGPHPEKPTNSENLFVEPMTTSNHSSACCTYTAFGNHVLPSPPLHCVPATTLPISCTYHSEFSPKSLEFFFLPEVLQKGSPSHSRKILLSQLFKAVPCPTVPIFSLLFPGHILPLIPSYHGFPLRTLRNTMLSTLLPVQDLAHSRPAMNTIA